MEPAVTEALLKTIRGLGRKYVEDVETEVNKFALILRTLHSVGLPAAAAAVPVAGDNDVLQHRVNMLESVVDRLIQEVGDMDSRVAYAEQMQADDMWHADGEPLSTNEILELPQEPVRIVKTGTAEVEADAGVVPAIPVVEVAAVVEAVVPAAAPAAVVEAVVPAAVVEAVEPEPVHVPVHVPVPMVESAPVPEVVPEADAEEEDEEEASLEEIEFEGKTYYKDEENNVYTTDDDGDIDPNPVGRWLVKSQKIKFFGKA